MSSATGSYADEDPERASFEQKYITHLFWKMRVQPLDPVQMKSEADFQPSGNFIIVDADTSLTILKVKEKFGESGIIPVIQRLFYHDESSRIQAN
ncbi:hypothetical protein OROMI_011153 [Orobanche minor]